MADLTVTGDTRIDYPSAVEWRIDADPSTSLSVDWGDDSTVATGDSGDTFIHAYPRPGRYTALIQSGDDLTVDEVAVTVGPPTGLRRGVCDPWITAEDVDCDVPDNATYSLDDIVDESVRWMFDATGGYWTGTCEAIIRPYTTPERCASRRWTTRDQTIDFLNYVRGPVTRVQEVVIDGEPISPDFYRVDRQRFLVPQDDWDGNRSPLSPWPPQDMNRPLGAERTWWAHVEVGEPPPPPLLRGVRRLVCEVILMLGGDEACTLPSNAVSVTSDGVTIQLRQRERGQVGVPFIDALIEEYGRSRPRRLVDPTAPDAAVHWLP